MNAITLRPEQDVKTLRAENNPVQKVEVKKIEPLGPLEIQRIQRMQAMTEEQLAAYNVRVLTQRQTMLGWLNSCRWG